MKKKTGKYSAHTLSKGTGISSIKLYCVLSVLALCSFLACVWISHGSVISQYFFYDTRDTGMDFFHSIEYVRGSAPYELYNTLYPPMANLFFLLIYRMIPVSVSEQWADTFLGGVAARGTDIDLRTHQAPMILFILVILVFSWLMISLVISLLRERHGNWANITALCLLLSPGMLIAFERGNILFMIVPLTLFFVKYRNDERAYMRELAIIALAIAAGMKLYPAFFGILLLRDKNYKLAIRAVIYGILSVVLPMLFFEEGLEGILMWLNILLGWSSDTSSTPWIGLGFANILHRVALYARVYLNVEFNTDWFTMAGYMVAILLLVSAMFMKKDWQSAVAIVMAMTMYQSQGQYIFSFVCIPVAMFLQEEDRINNGNIIPFLSIAGLTINLPLFYERDISYPNVAYEQLLSFILVCWCLGMMIHTIMKKIIRRTENGNLEK